MLKEKNEPEQESNRLSYHIFDAILNVLKVPIKIHSVGVNGSQSLFFEINISKAKF